MDPKHVRVSIVLMLVLCSGLLFIFPFEPVLNSEVIFDDEVAQILDAAGDGRSDQLILIITHDDGGKLTNNITRVQKLLDLEEDIMKDENESISFQSIDNNLYFDGIKSPFKAWSNAFLSRNNSLINASKWSDLLQPVVENGWCGDNSTKEEFQAFQATLLLLPKDVNYNIACPAFSGSSATQAPDANEIIWLIKMGTRDNTDADWVLLETWAKKISDETEYNFEAGGIEMLLAESKLIAENDVKFLLIPSLLFLVGILTIGLKNLKTSMITIGCTSLVILAEVGVLAALDFNFSVFDAIALPIIMGVAVDGAFWYCKSSRKREDVRKMLLIAMITTVTAISLALFSPIKAQRSLAIIMIIGIILDWIVTRFLLEDYFISMREPISNLTKQNIPSYHYTMSWFWPIALLILAFIAVLSPSDVEILDIKQFLPEDDPSLEELNVLQSKYILGSSTTALMIIDVEGDSTEDLIKIQNFQKQLSYHPSIITIETGLSRSPLIIGIPTDDNGFENSTIDSLLETQDESLIYLNSKIENEGVTTGVGIAALIDSKNSEAALEFSDDVKNLIEENGLTGKVGGDIVSGITMAKEFEKSRVFQILAAGLAVFIVTYFMLRSPLSAARIAIGTIAVGAAVDGMASVTGSRGVHTAPAVLLGMGFAADYLSHASAKHIPTRQDNSARWWAAISSMSVFALLGLATFPPAQNTGVLLTISILFAVLLATCLSLTHIVQIEEE
jgi:predicted RND superfamily exporter protein